MIEAYYVPIGAQTLVPVTTEDIQQKGQECVIDSKEETDRIMKMLDAASPVPATGEGFSGKTVRVKLLEKSSHGTQLIAFVENEGFVKRADGRQGVLAAADLAALKKLIESHLK